MRIEDMDISQIESRLSEIGTALEAPDADIQALTDETDKLINRKNTLGELEARRKELRSKVAGGAGTVTRSLSNRGEAKEEESAMTVDSPEYRSIWLRHLQGKQLTQREAGGYTSLNGAISTVTANAIMSVVRDHAPLLERMTVVRTGAAIKYYVEGANDAATEHTELDTILASVDTMTEIELTPKEIVKLIQISEAAEKMSVDAFEGWLADTLGKAIARKINSKIVATIATAAVSKGTTFTAADVQALMGAVKGDVSILCNNHMLYTVLLPLEDNATSSIVRFEGGKATIYGREVLVDDNVGDNVILAGDLSKMIAAIAEDINVKKQYDIDTNSYKYLGVALFDAKVGVSSAFAKLATV